MQFSPVQSFRQAVGFVFVLALVFGSGPNGVCSVWSVAGVNHDHHAGQEAVVVFEEVGQCGQPSVPCNDANEDLPDLQFSLPNELQNTISKLLIGVLPVPMAKFGAILPKVHFEPLLFYESVRLPSASLQLVFCRFLI